MKSFRLHSSARFFTVALVMISWLVATNHCAFGLMSQSVQAAAEHSHCHGGKPAPGKEGAQECCKSIHGAPVPAKAEVKFDATKFHRQAFALLEVLAAPENAGRAEAFFVFDHGPPRAGSFAESVLQRSLFGHAPPFV